MNLNNDDGCILTSTGLKFDAAAPTPAMICIEDIANGLARCCRFAGQCDEFYSVAQHSVRVSHTVEHGLRSARQSELCAKHLALSALLHDAPEAYLGDMAGPIKRLMPDYQECEDRLWAVIAEKFGVVVDIPAIVKSADAEELAIEQWALFGIKPFHEALKVDLFALSYRNAHRLFLDRFKELQS